MFNIVKRDMFNKTRATLSVDIDELVIRNGESTVFDDAVHSIMGAVSFREIRTFPNEVKEKAYPQRKHTMIKKEFKYGNTK